MNTLGNAVQGCFLIGDNLMQAGARDDLERSLRRRIGRGRDQARSNCLWLLPIDQYKAALGLAGYRKLNRHLLG